MRHVYLRIHVSPTYHPKMKNTALGFIHQEAYPVHRWLVGQWWLAPLSANKWFILLVKVSALFRSFQWLNLLNSLPQPHSTHSNKFSWHDGTVCIKWVETYAPRDRRYPLRTSKNYLGQVPTFIQVRFYYLYFVSDITETKRGNVPRDDKHLSSYCHPPFLCS